MRRIAGNSAKTALILAIALCAAFSVGAQTQGASSTSISISVRVPPVLQFSLNFGTGGGARIAGYLGGAGTASADGFVITPNSTVALGDARIVSNLGSGYAIIVQSSNGGTLKNPNSSSEISYDLLIDGVPAVRQQGSFMLSSSMRTSRNGSELPVSIALGSIPAGASAGVYSDNLLFNVSAN